LRFTINRLVLASAFTDFHAQLISRFEFGTARGTLLNVLVSHLVSDHESLEFQVGLLTHALHLLRSEVLRTDYSISRLGHPLELGVVLSKVVVESSSGRHLFLLSRELSSTYTSRTTWALPFRHLSRKETERLPHLPFLPETNIYIRQLAGHPDNKNR
jgi:hypothetical protein